MFNQKFWSNYFKVYDILNIVIPYQELMNELEKELDLKLDDIVLDVGSGTGNFMIKIKDKCKRVIGIDFSGAGVKIHKSKDPTAEVILSDITTPFPFPDNYFSKIVSNNTIYTLDKNQQIKALSEIYRVLKPGGKFVISNVKKNFSPFLIYKDCVLKFYKKFGILKTIIFIFSMIVPTIKMFYYNARIKKSGLTKQYNFFDKGEQGELLRKIGFINISDDKLVYSNQAIMNTCYKP